MVQTEKQKRDQYLAYRREKNQEKKFVPLERLQFEVHLVDHCNLNCVGCDNLSPICEPWFLDVQRAERDFRRLSELFGGDCSYIRLLGGEPLLHPQIAEFILLARCYFPKTDISVITNGCLLSRMSESFYETCRQTAARISISRYPIGIDYDQIFRSVHERGVEAFFNSSEKDSMYYLPLSCNGSENPRDSFILCHRSNSCITLREGRLYTCSLIPVAENLNRVFQTGFHQVEEDSIDIYAPISGKEILCRLAVPPKFCRFCKLTESRFDIPWKTSERSDEEWIIYDKMERVNDHNESQ